MSVYISKRELIDFLNEEMKQDRPDDLKIRNIQRYIDDATVDETEIIRKTVERVLEELKKEVMIEDSLSKNSTGEIKKMHTYGRNCLNVAIKKIKECGISE